ncbi:MAG: tRNA (guanosine(37)-N1)-methyltransferase TrmD [Candidatus Sungbacteria bacterium]|nr:tRNA (guanosine(37)-N1)-methyltransferase TrmD [Candidatus Sungbacteria bacterium]
MRFDIITIFPKIIDAYLGESILKRARTKKLAEFYVHDLRDFTTERHRKVDDRPFGGGPGMVLKIEPIVRALDAITRKTKNVKRKTKIILFSAGGKQFDSKMAADWAKKYDRIIMIAGRYEGMDERVKKIVQNSKLSAFGGKIENLSIGPYVLTGGELPALIVADAVSRHIPGVLGDAESLEEKRHGVGVPVYTRPEVFEWPASGRGKKKKKYQVPKVLLSGDHKKIEEWRKLHRRKGAV